jgi:hypothetical protein
LAQSDTFCSASDVPFIHESFKGKQEIQIDPADIHSLNISYIDYLFLK